MTRLARGTAVVLATIACLASLAANASGCKLNRLVEWPVQFRGGLPFIEGAINGQPIRVLLDTGAFASILTKAAAERLGLHSRGTGDFLYGIGGESRIFVARLDELRVGTMVRKDMRVRVGGERELPGIDFILGDDFFKELEIEFDYANGKVRLFRAEGCKGVALSYWDRNAQRVDLEGDERLFLTMAINGRPARALLDSGASSSQVTLSFAAKVGITPRTPGVAPSGCSAGIGPDLVHTWVARFDTVEIADQVTRDAQLHVADEAHMPAWYLSTRRDVILGADFLRAHRVLVSRGQRKAYFTYLGGKIFRAVPSAECDERVAGKSREEAIAFYDAAIAQDPNDARALLQRALIRARGDDAKRSLPDLDAVIRLEPDNALARAWRSSVRHMLKDLDGALADSDVAVAGGMRTAQMFYIRGEVHRRRQDHARALAEYDLALELDPWHAEALRSRGRMHFYAGRWEAAEGDFAAALARRPQAFDALWLSMSRARRGADGKLALEQALERLKEGEWPGPVMRYLLGRIDRDALLAAAAQGDETKRRSQECEARFYIAADLLAANRGAAARPLLERARDECPRDYIEYEGALAELKGRGP